ncbi:hypothetical protein LCGC14_2556360 [marine sediment metagenome]|uniref:Deoxynucleotide monophosphate kinase n=1 Tax=marine sediment metagenome TaxID=412755 RepID=A0A0F9DEH7_9ZZZZ
MRIVGIGYKKGSGKDQFASFMHTFIRCTAPGFCIKRMSFADKLKDIAQQLYGWTGLKPGIYYEAHRDEKEVSLPLIGKSPRQLWIEVGNNLRNVYPETWINFALRGAVADIIIITDVRFKNEAKAIHNQGGMLVKIDRPGIPQGTDPAEVELDSYNTWDLVVDNNRDLVYLNSMAESLSRKLINDIKAVNS